MLLGVALISLVTSTTLGCGVEVGVGVGFAAEFERDGCVPGTGRPTKLMLQILRSPRLHFHSVSYTHLTLPTNREV